MKMMEWSVKKDPARPVATIKFDWVDKEKRDYHEHHLSLGLALESVRFDDTVRVVVITGRDDGFFEVGPADDMDAVKTTLNPATREGGPSALRGPWSLSQGIERTFQALALMEKPVIARLNGHAAGFAMHILWGCDIIVADESVMLTDVHLGMTEGLPWGMSAGDGAFAFLPLFMTPTKLKEFLLTGPAWTAREFADLGLINYALSADQVDAKVEEFVEKFLARPIGPLVRTKRAANKRLIQQMNLTFDYAWMAESIDLWELAARDFKDELTLRPDDPAWTTDDPNAPLWFDPPPPK